MSMTEESTSLMTETPVAEAWHSEEYNDLATQRGWENADNVIKSYSELEKSASGKVKIPGEEASPEERSSFYNKIGRPDSPEGYEITDIPENVGMDDETLSQLRKDAFEAGVPKVAFETVLKNYLNRMSEQVVQSRVDGEKVLKEEVWKGDYDKNIEIAQRYVTEHCSDEFKQVLEDTGMGNNPVFAKHFYEQGKKVLSDTLIRGSQDSGERETEYKPAYPNDPAMYKNGDDDESKRAREYFATRGHVY